MYTLHVGAQPFSNASFGEGIVPVLGYVKCVGRERKLEECVLTELSDTVNCHHGKDVGVICQGTVINTSLCFCICPITNVTLGKF